MELRQLSLVGTDFLFHFFCWQHSSGTSRSKHVLFHAGGEVISSSDLQTFQASWALSLLSPPVIVSELCTGIQIRIFSFQHKTVCFQHPYKAYGENAHTHQFKDAILWEINRYYCSHAHWNSLGCILLHQCCGFSVFKALSEWICRY